MQRSIQRNMQSLIADRVPQEQIKHIRGASALMSKKLTQKPSEKEEDIAMVLKIKGLSDRLEMDGFVAVGGLTEVATYSDNIIGERELDEFSAKLFDEVEEDKEGRVEVTMGNGSRRVTHPGQGCALLKRLGYNGDAKKLFQDIIDKQKLLRPGMRPNGAVIVFQATKQDDAQFKISHLRYDNWMLFLICKICGMVSVVSN